MTVKEVKEDPNNAPWDQHVTNDNILFYTKRYGFQYYLKLEPNKIYEIDIVLTYDELVRGLKMFKLQEILDWINKK